MQDDQPFALETAWAQLGALMSLLLALFGAPAAIAACLIRPRKQRRDILQWLAPLEADAALARLCADTS